MRRSMHVALSEPELKAPTHATAYAWVSLKRWPDLTRGFLLLHKRELLAEAMCLSRVGSELAINVGWIAFARSGEFPTREARVAAMHEESRTQQKKWWEAMQRHDPEVQFSPKMVKDWTKFCAMSPESEPPPALCDRAVQQRHIGTLPEQLYDFAFRVDSQSMHSNTRVLVDRAHGRTALPAKLVLFNMLSAGRLLFLAASEVLDSLPLRKTAAELTNEAMRKPPPRQSANTSG
jgi:hypothetical protein